ncbi:MAG TPA: leucine--tRNA ligase [Candidatus Pacearchaeota archaeon]|nr:leucine--tRNA ligase [Candidatus Pacearchaeota archaeon]HRR94645.1 leucine--tRNA ligase [Candidatus Paceibacterota bacterium]HPC30351.1 leucine--tRNA ligase [Candidatus Pacearchaeota archaeon]HQG09041.1 leucine--tRNA ligase [Candidatus Pacearchaeota archaeon]HQH20022.1 leucine--tRNA ligase [Candidatus Pacearchaeota archaeon]
MKEQYQPQIIEKKWQDYWELNKIFETKEIANQPKIYILDMFPYPSGVGIHVGHLKGYVATDILARLKRMQGFNVLHPIGWDAFGLPAENFAVKTGIHPVITTAENIANIKSQFKKVGLSYDWDREINTTDPNYYKWTQWIFLKLYEHNLAYKKILPINWCPSCKTGLANEEVVSGCCERCGAKVTKKELNQWVLKITEYANRLLEDLEPLDWPEKIKEMQRNWIGRSEGWELIFNLKNSDEKIVVFTTRADTLFGCTYIVLAPEHPLIKKIINQIENKEEVLDYIEQSKNKSDIERISEVKNKTGIEVKGLVAINPINEQEIKIFVADYVLGEYGTGAVMAVPAHDERDFDFAKKYQLPIKYVIKPKTENNQNPFSNNIVEFNQAFIEDGILLNSGEFNGLSSEEAREKIGQKLKQQNKAEKKVNYKLRDWIFSRQRYWGEPIPIIQCEKCGLVPLEEKDLPLELPQVEKYEPTGTGESPLANISEWVNVKCPRCGGLAKRETNTMPQWAGSCWYYLRYLDPHNNQALVDSEKEKKWMPVDLYVGGVEHAVLHLLYARFWHKFLFDIGVVSTKEPFQSLRNQGLILAYDGQKMSKSKGNVVSPDEIIDEFGADTLRVYEMFMGPFDQAIIWNPQGVRGVFRFLNRTWDLIMEAKDNLSSSAEVMSETEKLIKKTTQELEKMKFNTAIAFFMEYINFVSERKTELGREAIEKFLIIFYPFAPHFCEELWEQLGHQESLSLVSWPKANEQIILKNKTILVVQINGKVRDKLEVEEGLSQEQILDVLKKNKKIIKWLDGEAIKNVIFVPNKIINLLTK